MSPSMRPSSDGDDADQADGDQDAQGESQRDAEGLARGELLLLADEADDQRDAGQVAGAEQDAQIFPR